MTAPIRLPVKIWRPIPPALLFGDDISPHFVPAPELLTWTRDTFIAADARLANPDHAHLADADVRFLWTNVPNSRRNRRILGTCEMPSPSGDAWKAGRQERQILDWFGTMPDFLITLDASYAATTDNASFCALIEHELYHAAQAVDGYGAPRFTKSGEPVWCIRGHDFEEFVGVVSRYGAAGELRKAVDAASRGPTVSAAALDGVCGTCARRAA